MKIYDDNGYLNIEDIAQHSSWLKVILGARQIGKTYGVLKYHLDHDIPHILLRRTTAELELIGGSAELNPYQAFEPDYHVAIFKSGKYYTINDYDENGKLGARGLALSLAQISHIRGFNGSAYQSIIFDEFIPEKGSYRLTTEGDSLLNAYTTINGNRELQGKPPCTLWLLANSNDINSPILEALRLTDDILTMRRKGKEIFYTDDTLILQPASARILTQRKEGALARKINGRGEFYDMAYNNDFAYDYNPLVSPTTLRGKKPLFSYDGEMYAWEDSAGIYICRAPHDINPYGGRGYDRGQLLADYLWVKRYYAEGLVTFSDLRLLAMFRNIFDIRY